MNYMCKDSSKAAKFFAPDAETLKPRTSRLKASHHTDCCSTSADNGAVTTYIIRGFGLFNLWRHLIYTCNIGA